MTPDERIAALEARVEELMVLAEYHHLEAMAMSFALRDFALALVDEGRPGSSAARAIQEAFAEHLQKLLESVEDTNPALAAALARIRPDSPFWEPPLGD